MGTTLPRISEMIVGQSWQLLELVYTEEEYSRRPLKQVIVTGNEAVSRYGSRTACQPDGSRSDMGCCDNVGAFQKASE